MKTVRIIRRHNDLFLIQWAEVDDVHRGWIPESMVEDLGNSTGQVENPAIAIPYGVQWSEHVSLAASPRDLEKELRRRGIWTTGDLRAQPQVAISCLQSVYGVDLAALLTAAKEIDDMEVS
jgi:hypothetical protein